MPRFILGAGLVSILVVAVAGCGSDGGLAAQKPANGGTTSKPPVTVGLVTDVGGLNDKSFNHLAYVGLKQAEAEYGVTGAVVQSHSAADYVPNLTKFAQQGKSLTIAVGFLMQNAVWNVAKQYPNRHFAIIDGQPVDNQGRPANLPNVANLFFKEEQSGYLVGVIAGLMEKNHVAGAGANNTIGMVGGQNFPAVTGYMCGYLQGARSVDPHVSVISDFSNTFTDAQFAKQLGLDQISKGADILFQVDGGAGLGYLSAAQQGHKFGIGVDADQDYLGSYVLTSALKKVNQAVALEIGHVVNGKFKGGNNVYSVANGATGYAPDTHHVPAAILAAASLDAHLIAAGKIKINPMWGTFSGQGSCKL